MKRLLVSVIVSTLLSTSCAAQGSEGAIVHYERSPAKSDEATEFHYLRDGMVRIDRRTTDIGKRHTFLEQEYSRPNQPFSFRTIRTLDGSLLSLSIMDDGLSSPPAAASREWTGATETHLGEQCRVWENIRTLNQSRSFKQSGCVTDDGIELWQERGAFHTIRATNIVRTSVPIETVRVPFSTLDVSALMREGAGTSNKRDYALKMRGPRGEEEVRIRSGNWRYIAQTSPSGFSRSARNALTGVRVQYSQNKRDGRRYLHWSRPPLIRIVSDEWLLSTPLPDRPARFILGEKCTMRKPIAFVSEGGRVDCLTDEGIPLYSAFSTLGHGWEFYAVSLSRKPQALADITLPDSLTAPTAWQTE